MTQLAGSLSTSILKSTNQRCHLSEFNLMSRFLMVCKELLRHFVYFPGRKIYLPWTGCHCSQVLRLIGFEVSRVFCQTELATLTQIQPFIKRGWMCRDHMSCYKILFYEICQHTARELRYCTLQKQQRFMKFRKKVKEFIIIPSALECQAKFSLAV